MFCEWVKDGCRKECRMWRRDDVAFRFEISWKLVGWSGRGVGNCCARRGNEIAESVIVDSPGCWAALNRTLIFDVLAKDKNDNKNEDQAKRVDRKSTRLNSSH